MSSKKRKHQEEEVVEATDQDVITYSTEHKKKKTQQWLKEDIIELIKRIKVQVPDKDHLRYTSRAEKLDWNKIQFGSYSVDDCYNKWKTISKKIRSYRLLHEVVADAEVWADKPWTDFYSKGKKKRHPDHPSRPLSSYMLYYMAQKNKVAKRNPDMKLTDIEKIIVEKYNALPEHKKAKYVETAKKMQEAYRKELVKFYENHPKQIPKPKKHSDSSKSRKEAGAPAKPLTPFKMLETYKLEFANYLESLPPEKRAEELAKNHPKRKANIKPKVQPEKEQVRLKTKKKSRTLFKGEPEPPRGTLFELFLQYFTKENKHLSSEQCEIQAVAQWKKLSQAEKNKYHIKREQAKLEYLRQFEKFIRTLNEADLKEYSLMMKSKEDKVISDPSSGSSEDSEEDSEESSDEKTLNEADLKEYSLMMKSKEDKVISDPSSGSSEDSEEDSEESSDEKTLNEADLKEYSLMMKSKEDKVISDPSSGSSEDSEEDSEESSDEKTLNEADLKEYSLMMKSKEDKVISDPSSGSSEDSEEDSEESSNEKESNKGESSDDSSSSASE